MSRAPEGSPITPDSNTPLFSPRIHDEPFHPISKWFEQFRGDRERARATFDPEEGRLRRRAIITMVHNESLFLPIWLKYYSQFFEAGDIYVLDNDTTDGSTSGDGFVRIPVAHDSVDHRWMVETIQDKQNELFADGYGMVLVTDVDEIILPDPRLGDLGDYMDSMGEEFVTCLGYEIVHVPDREQPLDPEAPVMPQRHFWSNSPAYQKSLLSTKPNRWIPGFHRREDGAFNCDPDLYLIHLHRVDYDACLSRHELRKKRRWNSKDVEAEWATHNRKTDPEEFDRWFFTDSGVPGFPLRIEPIPEGLREGF